MKKLNEVTIGWINYYGIAKIKDKVRGLESWIRRLRACIWKQWKKVRTRFTNLMRLEASRRQALGHANTRKGYWRISNSPILSTTLTNQYLENFGYKSISKRYQLVHSA